MTERYDKYANVDDFIIYKMQQLIDTYAKVKRADITKVLGEALDDYVQGKHDIIFVDGWPHIVKESERKGKQK
tara:strand:+ start:2053 stop:2271 length:219 start_codon:yes stop_codon:yes gene_type:complete